MDLKNVGGTPGGTRTFLLGMGMAIVGGYLLLQEVQVHGGYWNWGFGGYGRSFGITLIPLLLGVGMLFANGRSFAGRFLTGIEIHPTAQVFLVSKSRGTVTGGPLRRRSTFGTYLPIFTPPHDPGRY